MKSDTPSARSSRLSASWHSLIKLLLFGFILLMINYWAFNKYVRTDLSASQFYTLSNKTKDVLSKLDSPVVAYTLLDARAGGQAEEINNLLKEYAQAGGKNFTVENIDETQNLNRAVELQKQLHFGANDRAVIFTYKDRSPRYVKEEDMFDFNQDSGKITGFKGEQQMTAALLSLIEGKAAKIYFTEGHGEHAIDDLKTAQGYGAVGHELQNDNVEVANLNIVSKGGIPDDAQAVVIAGPQIPFSPIEAQALDQYLANNGKLFVLLDPYYSLGLDDLLLKYGLKFNDDLVLYRLMTENGGSMTVPLAFIYQNGFSPQPITSKFALAGYQLQINGARSISVNPDKNMGDKANFLLQTDPNAWGWVNKGNAANVNIQQLTFNPATDNKGPVVVAAQYDGGETTDPKTKATIPATRIVVIGAAKFLENDNAEPVGTNFFTNAIDWLVKQNAVLDINPKKPQEYGVFLNPISFRTLAWCAEVIIPISALLFGIATWVSRRK